MIEDILCNNEDNSNYCRLPENRKDIYREIYKKYTCSPERYIFSVVVPDPKSNYYACVTVFDYEEYQNGSRHIVESKNF